MTAQSSIFPLKWWNVIRPIKNIIAFLATSCSRSQQFSLLTAVGRSFNADFLLIIQLHWRSRLELKLKQMYKFCKNCVSLSVSIKKNHKYLKHFEVLFKIEKLNTEEHWKWSVGHTKPVRLKMAYVSEKLSSWFKAYVTKLTSFKAPSHGNQKLKNSSWHIFAFTCQISTNIVKAPKLQRGLSEPGKKQKLFPF